MYFFLEITTALAVLTVASQVFIVLAGISRLPWFNKKNGGTAWVQKYYNWLGFIISLVAVSSSLYFSDIVGLEPCKLCWFQRILIYPQLILFGVSLVLKKGKEILPYSITMAGIGWLIAAYHYTIQMSETARSIGESIIPCSTVGMTPSCSSYWFLKFGYITIPMMSLTTLSLLIVLALLQKADRPSLNS
ncbi:disulfide bond formation protein B [Candidatus Peregrinibacteria bacterium]|nr:MAG: disulfide bond formation protein B [Candidatus Peregrinibacteria bacterium]